MDITWLGHAGVRIKSGSTALIMDPFPDSLGLRLPPQQSQANVVTIFLHTGDFAIRVVPMLQQDMEVDTKLWSYFCQISDSTTSYGSYSGAPPNEKITWGKIGEDTPRFIIESDATLVAPLLFAYVLGE